MKTPTRGQRLRAADGAVWVIEAVHQEDGDEDDGFFLVDIVPLAGIGNPLHPDALELDPEEFSEWCAQKGVALEEGQMRS